MGEGPVEDHADVGHGVNANGRAFEHGPMVQTSERVKFASQVMATETQQDSFSWKGTNPETVKTP